MANYCYKVMFGTLVLGLIAFLIVNVRQHVLAQGQLKLVRTLTGPVRGERRAGRTSDPPRQYYAFRGIPYAERPIGVQRFKAAQPVRPWKAVRSCYEHAAMCMQLNAAREVIGSEDCLYLNVYTPDVDPPGEQLRAVLVWLPGEDWFSGSGNVDHLGPEFLVEQDVIVVTVNYRLGVLGFLNLDMPEVVGNQGLGDQQLALDWIVENVRLFGGDRTRITLGGAGAGAVAVQLHMYAERSAGLFSRAIQMGTSFRQWTAFERPSQTALRNELLTLVRRPPTRRVNNVDLLGELQAIDGKVLVETFTPRSHPWLGPSVEMVTEMPPMVPATADWRLEADRSNWTTDKDVLAGYTSAEAIAIVTATSYEQFRGNATAKPLPFRVRRLSTSAEVWSRIGRRYFANATDVTRAEYVRLLTDVYQRYLVDRRLRYVAAHSTAQVYRYRFGLDTQLNAIKRWTHKGEGGLEGAAHGDDLCYVFRCEALEVMYANVTQASKEYKHIAAMSRMYANFVKSGTPGMAGWRPMNAEGGEFYMDITSDGWLERSGDFAEERTFWNAQIEGGA